MRRGEMERAAHYYRESLEHLDRAQQSGTDVVDALNFLAQHTFVSSRCLCGSAMGSRCTAASCWRWLSTFMAKLTLLHWQMQEQGNLTEAETFAERLLDYGPTAKKKAEAILRQVGMSGRSL